MANRNGNSNQRDDATTAALKHFEATASVPLANGVFLVDAGPGSAQDHAHMRAAQLASLLLLMRMNEAQNFRVISDAHQVNLLWLATQLADELRDMLPIVAEEVRQEARA